MFEQSILAGHPTNKGFGFVISLSAQMIVLAIAILIPLLYTNQLPFVALMSPLTVPLAPPATPARQPASSQRSAASRPAPTPNIFVAPQRIPSTIATIVDAPSVMELPSSQVGVPGGVEAPGGLSVLNNLLTKPAPPHPEPVKQAAPSTPIRVSQGVQEAKLIHKVLPIYPPLARQARISGVVRLTSIIAKDGTIRNLQVISGQPLLVGSAVDAVRQWVYRPTLLNGEPVEVLCPIDVTFNLN